MKTLEIGKDYIFAMMVDEEQAKTASFVYNGNDSWTLTTPKGTMTKVSAEQSTKVLDYINKDIIIRGDIAGSRK